MSIPLVKKLDLDSINTSIIAIKRLLQQAGVSEGGNTIINNNSGSGVPLGTWASFENDSAPNGEWLQAGTTFDANTYPALAMMLGGNTVPERFDHNRPSEFQTLITRGTTVRPFTAEYDADITIELDSSENRYVTVNGDNYEQTSTTATNSITLSVKKGDIVSCTGSSSISAWAIYGVYYSYPMFIKATPTSSDSDYEGTLNAIRQYVENNAVRTKVWVKQKNTTGQAINLVGIVIPNASKVTSLGFATIHRANQYDPMQYYVLDLPNTSSFVMGIGEYNVSATINGTYDSTNDTWTITSVSGVSATYWCQFCANYGEVVTVKTT